MNVEYGPCSVCDKNVKGRRKAIFCDACSSWVHSSCNKLDNKGYDYHSIHPDAPFSCLKCLEDNIPFSKLDNNQFNLGVKLGINYIIDECNIDYTPRIRDQKFFIEVNKTIYNSIHNITADIDNDDEEDFEVNMNCKYYGTEDFLKGKFKENKTFSILHLNIHSIEYHIEDLRILLHMLNFKFDFICISESKIQKNVTPKTDISIAGYQTPVGTPTEAKKGGVLMYIKEGINYKPRTDLNMYKPKELESYFVEVVNQNAANSIVGVIYRHPCMDANSFNSEYLKPLNEKLGKDNKKKYITGDFNFDLLKTANHSPTYDFLETFMTNLILPSITIPTRLNPKNNSLIDNIFTNNIHPDLKSGNLIVGISDHLPSFMIVPKSSQNYLPKKHNIYKRDTKNFDRENFILEYLDIDWETEIGTEDVNKATEIFFKKMNELIDKYTPLKKITQKEYKRRLKPWITNHITNMIREKNKLLTKMVKCKDLNQKAILNAEFKQMKNEITSLTKNSKKDYYDKYFTKHKDNLGKTWQGIKEIINIKAKNSDYPSCIIVDGKTITDPTEIASQFNTFYVSIADNILEKRKYAGKKSFKDYLPLNTSLDISLALYSCDEDEVKNLLFTLNPKKASGPNSIPVNILHLLASDICKPLSIIFNLSFDSGIYPDMLKIANAIPIFKKDSKLVVSNYRPISLLSNINKLLEKLMFNRVYKFLEDNKCLYSFQFGFRTRHSTNQTLISITESIRAALDEGKVAGGVFVDFQKAFDTVNHDILVWKLNHYGVRGVANNWFASYLSNRNQYVSILGHNSPTLPIHHGVPQGSVLGPLLFLIYINDLHKAIKFSKVYHFADDTNLLNVNESPSKLQKELNRDLKLLYEWLLANKISLNCTKTEAIIFHKPGFEPTFNFKIKLNGHRIRPSDSIKYLGIYLDSTLSGKTHCEILSKKLKRANGMLSKIRHYVPQTELRSIYFAIFSSHMTYGAQIWGQTITTHNEKIFKLQNRAMRIISFSDYRAEAEPLYITNNILKLENYIKIQNCLFVHDFLHEILPSCFSDYFQKLDEVYTGDTRTVNSELGCLFTPFKFTQRYGICSIIRKCVDSWNFLTKTLKTDLSKLSRPVVKDKINQIYGVKNKVNNNNNNIDNIGINNANNRRIQNNDNRRIRNNHYGDARYRPRNQPFRSRWDPGPLAPGLI